MEPRLLMAAARANGLSGYSGTLSLNPSIRQMQLSCDPDEPIEGSTSVRYDATKVTLFGYEFGPGYGEENVIGSNGVSAAVGSGDGYVAVRQVILRPGLPPLRRVILQEINSYLQQPAGSEVGYVQFRYTRNTQPVGQVPVPTGFQTIESGGVDGVDTHALYFNIRDGTSNTAVFTYTVYAAPANQFGGNPADYLVANDAAHTRIEANQLTPATVSSLSFGTYVSGLGWTGTFLSYLGRSFQGSSSLGYRVADISRDAYSAILPWTNLDTISIAFNRNFSAGVNFDATRVKVLNSAGGSIPVQFISYNATDRVGTIRLTKSLSAGEVLISLDLDEYQGVDRTLFLHPFPGDVDRTGGTVVANDLVRVRNRIGQVAPKPPIIITKSYSTLVDVDGSGAITATDLVLVRNRIGILPTLAAGGAVFSERHIYRPLDRLDELN